MTAVNGTTVLAAGGFQPSDFGLVVGDSATLEVTATSGASRTVTLTVAAG